MSSALLRASFMLPTRIVLRQSPRPCLFRQQPPRAQLRSQSSASPPPKPKSPTTTTNKSPKPPTEESSSSAPVTSSIFHRLGPITTAGRAYGHSQRTRPYTTQIATAFLIFLASDLSAQYIGGKDYDPVRTCRTVAIGLVAAIPQYKWFIFLSKNFNYRSIVLSMATKVVVNQLCFTPVFLTYFFGFQALLSGDSIAATVDRVRSTLPVGWVNAWKVWPAATVVNFAFVPMEYRSVFAGVIAVGWQTYLSYLNKQAELKEAAVAALEMDEKADVLSLGLDDKRVAVV